MIILRNKQFSNKEELNRLGRKTDKDIRKAVEGTKVEEKVDKILDKSTKEMKEAAKEPTSSELFEKWRESGDDKDAYDFMNAWVKDTYRPARERGEFVKTSTEAEKAAHRYLMNKEKEESKQKNYSKQDREVVPDDIVEKVKNGGGVIQKDHNGDWRIISMKTKTNKSGKPEFWPQKSKNREDMVKILQSYHSNKH